MFHSAHILIAVMLMVLCVKSAHSKDDVIVVASNAVEDFGILESLTNATRDQTPAADETDVQEASVSRVLKLILWRGRELIKILPRLGIVVARRLLDHVPSPAQVLNFGKQVLIGLPQEVIAYAIDLVCEYITIIII